MTGKDLCELLLGTGHKQAAQGDRRGVGHRQKEEESPEREEKGNMVTQFLKQHQKTSADDWTQQKRSSFPASVSFTQGNCNMSYLLPELSYKKIQGKKHR